MPKYLPRRLSNSMLKTSLDGSEALRGKSMPGGLIIG
jgi:hypothetical protein